jgi:hypothetical protein
LLLIIPFTLVALAFCDPRARRSLRRFVPVVVVVVVVVVAATEAFFLHSLFFPLSLSFHMI